MKKVIILLLTCLLFVSNVYAIEDCTPSDAYLHYMSLSDEEKENFIEPSYCKEIIEKKENNNELVSFFEIIKNSISASMTDSYYNAANDGLLSASENQGNIGTCWAFSSISAVETNARKNNVGSYNFSESHMIYSVLSSAYNDSAGKVGKYNTANFDGGKVTYAASYYFNNIGQLNERDMPYSPTYTKINSSQYKQGKKMISLGGFSLANLGNYAACTTDEITYIKNQITSYGSVQVSMYMDDKLFKDSARDYYISTTSNSNLPNHGVSIVGWDDNISGSKFGVSKNGAWIIKNSWGPTWSSDGLFYVSYADNFICKNIATFFDVSNTTYENTYASADVLGVPTFTFGGTFYISAKFTKQKSNAEVIKRVSFPVGENSKYFVYLVPDNNIENSSSWQLIASGQSNVYGIRSININKMLYDDFTIAIKYTTAKTSSVFTMCNNLEDTSDMQISSNKNYYSVNGRTWLDMNNIVVGSSSISCEPNIYAYTNNVVTPPSTGSITINSTTSQNDKITVAFTNNGVNNSDISYAVYLNNNNVSSHFTITPDYTYNRFTIVSDGKISGTFNFIIRYSDNKVSTNFTLNETINPKDNSVIKIKSDSLIINIDHNSTFTYSNLMSLIETKNTEVKVLSVKGGVISSSNSIITTNCKLKLNNKTYQIVILGDINEDGKITSLDYNEIKMHIMGTKLKNNADTLSADLDGNNKINAVDYIILRKIIMR